MVIWNKISERKTEFSIRYQIEMAVVEKTGHFNYLLFQYTVTFFSTITILTQDHLLSVGR